MKAEQSKADIVFYGGAAGGGKTDLAIGKALTQHRTSIIFRRESMQLVGIIQRLTEILGARDGYNSQTNVWEVPGLGRRIEFGSCQHLGDEIKYQGRPHSLKVFDEITHFLEAQFRFLCGWLRTTDPGEPKQILCTGNPPTTAEGDWVRKFWAPWLDTGHPNPAMPGELRWFAMLDGVDTEVDGPELIEHRGEEITPQSRTFIPSSVEDNEYLMETGYKTQLQALPEPLRSQMLQGDFAAGMDDSMWQVIPSEWVDAAMARWKPRDSKGEMDSMGVDPARGGKDETVIACRYGMWFDELKAYPGKATPDGPAVAALVVMERRNGAPVHVDVIGVGGSVYDHLKDDIQTIPINGAEGTKERTKDGTLEFYNMRALLYWRLREALDPVNDTGIALPLDGALKADLCAPEWRPRGKKILIEDKEQIKKRIGRSPDRADAVANAMIETIKRSQQAATINFASEF